MHLLSITSILATIAMNSANEVPAATQAPAPGGQKSHSHTHSHDEIFENHGPVLLDITYTGEVMANAAGGIDTGARYLDNLDLVLETDLDALIGWRGAELHIYGIYNNGASISELTGDAFAVSNIETGSSAFRLYEFWIDQKIGDSFSMKFGLYDLNSEFDSLEASGLFVGSAHGIGADISQTGLNGPSIFPATSLALRLEKTFSSGLKIRTAILDAVPGDPDRPDRTLIDLNSDEGALVIGELEIPVAGARLLAGHWRYTAEFEDFDGAMDRGNSGFYLRGETALFETDGRKLDGFFRLGNAASRFNTFNVFASAGVKLTGVTGAGQTDELGLAVAKAWTTDGFRETASAGKSETVFELTYRREALPFLTLQPSLQYVLSPSADPTIDDALVLGLRFEVTSAGLFN